MRKRLVAGMIVMLMCGSAGAALASGGPKNGSGSSPNEHGLCTAADNGNKNGWGSTAPGPFTSLQQKGENAENTTSTTDLENSADARQDIEQACTADSVVVGGQGHGFPSGS